jgi:hypothetical protein
LIHQIAAQIPEPACTHPARVMSGRQDNRVGRTTALAFNACDLDRVNAPLEAYEGDVTSRRNMRFTQPRDAFSA